MAIKIALDVGHGLYTAGKQTPDGIKEWTLNDKVADKVAEYLKDYDAIIYRLDNNEGGTDEPLADRLTRYLSLGVAVMVSIHHNAYTSNWSTATGVETYVDNKATAEDLRLANCIHSRLVKNTGLRDRGIKRADFYIINQNKIPAILCEGGFMDGSNDYKIITSDAGQAAYAKAVAEGLIEYLGLQKKVVSKPASKPVSTDTVYVVKKGDNLSAIAAKYNTTWQKLAEYNNLNNPSLIYAGQEIKIPKVANAAKPTTTTKPAAKPTAKPAAPSITVGSKVKMQQGAPIYGTNNRYASWVYSSTLYVREIKGDRVVISTQATGAVTGAVDKKYLTLK